MKVLILEDTHQLAASKGDQLKGPLAPDTAEIARRLRALSDPTRLRIIDLLRSRDEGELTEALRRHQVPAGGEHDGGKGR